MPAIRIIRRLLQLDDVDGTPTAGQVLAWDGSKFSPASKADASHTHTVSQVTDAGSAASRNVPSTGDATSSQVVLGSDSRLSDARTPTSHTHTASQVTDLSTAISGKENKSEKDQASGYAGLNSQGKLSTSVLPPLSITSVTVVASQAAQLALGAQEGDVVVRSDTSRTYVHNGGSAGTMADFTELAVPPDVVQSVAGKTGTVTLDTADVGGLATALSGKANTSHTHTLSDVTDAGTAASRSVPSTGNATSTQVVLGSDTRLSDARTPTAHTHTLSAITDAGTAASKNVPASGDAASGEVVLGSDTRLVRYRTRLATVSAVSTLFSNSTAETDAFRYSVSGAAANDVYELLLVGDLLNNSGSSCNLTWRVKLGTTDCFGANGAYTCATNANRRTWQLRVHLFINSTSAQIVHADLGAPAAAAVFVPLAGHSQAYGNLATTQDMTTAKDLAVTVKSDTAASTIDMRLAAYYFDRMRP